MKTKTKKIPAPKGAKKVPAVTAKRPLSPTLCAEIHVHPSKVEFFEKGAAEPYSRIANGGPGSDAAQSVAVAIKALRGDGASLRRFNEQGAEIIP